MVFASLPVSSVIRFAARPVGAASSGSNPRFSKSFIIALSVVVLPVPGPPVSTKMPLSNASVMALRCNSSNFIPSCRSTLSISSASAVMLRSIYRFTASSRAAIHLSSAAVSGHCISTICICYPHGRNAHKRFHLKRGQRYAVQSNTGTNSSFCRSIT